MAGAPPQATAFRIVAYYRSPVTVRGRFTLLAAFAGLACGAIAAGTWSQFRAIRVLEARMIARRAIRPRDADFGDLLDQSQDLGLMIVMAITGLMTLVLICGLVLRSSLLQPLYRLGEDLQRVARQGLDATPIRIQGPTEIARVAADAETMRRALQLRAREAWAADAGLRQQAPLVHALRQPTTSVHTVGNLLIAGSVHAASGAIGGDWWDVRAIDGARTAVIVGDVVGHDEHAALTRHALRVALLGALLDGQQLSALPALGCQVLHGCEGIGGDLSVASCVLMVIDSRRGTLTWINAGHPTPLWFTAGTSLRHCPPTGPWLTPYGGQWSALSRPFSIGDVLLAFTDGLMDSRGEDDRGEDDRGEDELSVRNAFEQAAQRWQSSGDREVNFPQILSDVQSHVVSEQPGPHRDDISLIALTCIR